MYLYVITFLQGERKSRLFTKNSEPKLSPAQKKLMKTKSDEASNSLLRYFRFPSPPQLSADNSDSASIDPSKHTHVCELQNVPCNKAITSFH